MTLTIVSNDLGMPARVDWALTQTLRSDLKVLLTVLAAHGGSECINLVDLSRRIPASTQRTQELLDELAGKGRLALRPAPAGWIEYEVLCGVAS